MNPIIEQYTDQLDRLFSQSNSKRMTPVLTTPTQLLIPANPWDWEVVADGSVSAKQFLFADYMPKSSKPATIYTASSNSFTDNYRTFLEVIPDTFPSPELLNTAKTNIKVPAGDPANDPTPPGWTKVTIAGIIRWEPIYSVSMSADEWKLDVETGKINNPGTIDVNLRQKSSAADPNIAVLAKSPDVNDASQVLDSSVFEQVTIAAESWGQIFIYPGSWFSSGVISLSKQYVSKDVFKNLLHSRVSAFYVAYKPVFKFSSATAIDKAVLTEISATPELYAFGVQVQAEQPPESPTSIELKAASPDPSIIGVVIETFT